MKRGQGYDFHVADWLNRQAWDLEEQGRIDEALPIYRRAAAMGDHACQMNLARLLTDREGADWAEGVLWYRRMLRAGDPGGAWNLAMVYRVKGNRRRYLSWLRRAALMGEADAVAILAEIERRMAARQPWPMFVMQVVDADDAIWMLNELREGAMDAQSVADWAGKAVRGENTLELRDDAKGRLVSVLTEMADPARPLSRQRALELLYKLG